MTDTNTSGTQSAVKLNRYTFHSLPDRHSEDGRWVQYSEAVAAIAAAEQRGRAPSPAVRALVEACKRFSEGWIYCREDDYEGVCCEPCSDVSRMRKALAAVEKEIG